MPHSQKLKNNVLFPFLFLSALYGIILFKLSAGFLSPESETTNLDFLLYMAAWFLCIPAGLLLGRLAGLLQKKYFQSAPLFYPILVFLNFLFALLILYPAPWGLSPPLLGLIFLLFQASGIILAKILAQPLPQVFSTTKLSFCLTLAVPLLTLLWFSSFAVPVPWVNLVKSWIPLNFLFFLTIIFLFHFTISPATQKPSPSIIFPAKWGPMAQELVLCFVAISLVALAMDTHFHFNRYHDAFYLGPLADLRAGKTLLVDVNAQYGILVFYFLGFFFHFMPLGYLSLSLVLAGLTLLQYSLFYFICRQLFQSKLLSFFCLSALLLVNHFVYEGYPDWYPSSGPLRFGFIYVLAALVVLRNRFTDFKKYSLGLESLTIAIAVFWSFEVFVYTVPAYLGLLVYESTDFGNRIRIDWKRLGQSLGLLAGFVFAILVCLYADIFLRAHELPHWSYYFEYIFAYNGGLGALPLPESGYWWMVLAIYGFSLFALLGTRLGRWPSRSAPPHLNVVALVTFYGIFQFLYYLWRPAPSNLLHIAMPSILLFTYWLYFTRRFEIPSVPKAIRIPAFTLLVIGMGVYLQEAVLVSLPKIRAQILALPGAWHRITEAAQDLPRDDQFARTAEKLFDKYSSGRGRLYYFFGQKGYEVAMVTGKVKVYPYNDLVQASYFPGARNRVFTYSAYFDKGEIIYLSKDFLGTFEEQIVSKLFEKLRVTHLETNGGISVFRVEGPRVRLTGVGGN
jgi:hypothetical protein